MICAARPQDTQSLRYYVEATGLMQCSFTIHVFLWFQNLHYPITKAFLFLQMFLLVMGPSKNLLEDCECLYLKGSSHMVLSLVVRYLLNWH